MQTVIGVFDDISSAQRAMERVTQAGVPRDQVHLEPEQGATASASTGTAGSGQPQQHQGVMASIGSFFANLFESHADHGVYSEAVNRGSMVLVVDAQTDEQADRAADLMRECGAIDIDERAQQWRAAGWDGMAPGTQAAAGAPVGTHSLTGSAANVGIAAGATGAMARGTDAQSGVIGQQKLNVVEEELQVGKRAVDRGGVRVIQRVSERPVRELVRLREEHAIVERHAVDRPATPADLQSFTEGEIEVREVVEEPVVAKTAHVVEEVVVGKQVREREEAISDTVRRKDVEVERLDGKAGTAARERAVASDTPRTGGTPDLLGRERDPSGGRR
ncbi:YsnF/AvaK domain-containing protein [Ramlibacter tataouinensis]|uniref:DUF2382 domain-containing protein n=1 Tax=Ramlibacter tataouinensis (strain ATCC BAA-407 / DSM 14655 / LMG 21543 / TTB310) TaxID=365046 RepID=F5XYI6_RAMTT|nr:YsnF/AvaK domain-containing protein [Ramlibacter tataouinensis]AEG93162.1 hypothetical protein Rta_20690 [Ramlibacter tataouinensis TTB310]